MGLKTLVAMTTRSRDGTEILEGAAEDLFAHAERIHVGGVEEVDPELQSTLE